MDNISHIHCTFCLTILTMWDIQAVSSDSKINCAATYCGKSSSGNPTDKDQFYLLRKDSSKDEGQLTA